MAPIDLTSLQKANLPVVWVLGGPGSGKGTQCDRIIEKYGLTHLSTGDLLRAEVASGSECGKNLTSIMELGELVPNDIVLDLLKKAMLNEVDTSKGFLIDGYPREKDQGVAFENEILPCTIILYFDAPDETLISRLLGRAVSSGRADDNIDTIKLRLRTFLENNDKVLDLYPEKLKRINADASVDEIFEQVEREMDAIISSSRRQSLRDFKLPIIWVLGGPGSGKGTQCERIVAKYGFTHLSTGDLLREEVASGSDRGKDFSAIMQKGDLIANDIILELLTEAISKNVATSKGFLIDGYPREKDQGVAFENAISSPAVILYFDASEETLTNRLQERSRSSGRADDNEETIKLCLQTFLKNNDAVIAQYPDILKRINAENSVDEIFVQVEEELDAII